MLRPFSKSGGTRGASTFSILSPTLTWIFCLPFRLGSTHFGSQLSDGNKIPILGFGTYEIDAEDAYEKVTWALEAGYRHIDSAAWYENEREVGKAISDFLRKHSLSRSDIFYTTKLKANDGFEASKRAIQKSLKACGLGYIDLYLIHGPEGGKQMRIESWDACLWAKREGLVKSVGISTFGVRHIEELKAWVEASPGREMPSIHQIDLHPFQTRKDVVDVCKQNNIVLEAWAPLVRGLRFQHPSIVKLSKKYGKEPAHILLRYSIQKGYVVIPKSSHKNRIQSNLNIFDFELGDNEISHLDGLDEGLVTDWDPTHCPW